MQQISKTITDPNKLLQLLNLKDRQILNGGINNYKRFPLRVPLSFFYRMKKGDPLDPLLLQVLTVKAELETHLGFSVDPNKEHNNKIPGLLHKYHNRVLLLVKNSCAVNCRYCFRRYFPYRNNRINKSNWIAAINYIKNNIKIDEVILSGGDPLMAKDYELSWLINKIENILHIKRLRIHTRLPVVIPERITDTLCEIFSCSRLQIIMVTHINHANEINDLLIIAMQKLKRSGVSLFNQSVLLRQINDNFHDLLNLSNALFDAGILPYYLHLLDKVNGAAHFLVTNAEAQQLIKLLLSKVSGYLVPKLVK
ncbi:L-lysine 2,3-aminomutase [Candidatus Providencia siddallii]|uniref:L-lysine 2,3-aminomutase n=1 Tax=Candidatus Providencia siddallii TaxID=1715285 RepID=A0A0M6W6P2_9GAMM|nr:L-lysine 2,3-aminomutase [Candidatus Providencia siddallii]